jgi:flavodoxin
MTRILVAYYSRSGNTRKIARQIAATLNADVEEIIDTDRRQGIRGYLRSGRQAFFRKMTSLQPEIRRPSDYDLVVIGSPIWNISLSSPVRTYIRQHRREIKDAAFFCTCGGSGAARVFEQMAEESGQRPVALLAVREAELDSPQTATAISRFCGALVPKAGVQAGTLNCSHGCG